MHRNTSSIHAYTITSLHMGALAVTSLRFKSRSYMTLGNVNFADLGCDNISGKLPSVPSLFLGLCLSRCFFVSLVVRAHKWHWKGLKGTQAQTQKKKKPKKKNPNLEIQHTVIIFQIVSVY